MDTSYTNLTVFMQPFKSNYYLRCICVHLNTNKKIDAYIHINFFVICMINLRIVVYKFIIYVVNVHKTATNRAIKERFKMKK